MRPDRETNDIAHEVARRRGTLRLAMVVVSVAIVASLIAVWMGWAERVVGAAIFAVVFVIAAFVNIRVWRCPACNGHLGRLYIGIPGPRHCPQCGTSLVKE